MQLSVAQWRPGEYVGGGRPGGRTLLIGGSQYPGARLLARSPLTGGGSGGPLRWRGLRGGLGKAGCLMTASATVPCPRPSPVWVMIPDSVGGRPLEGRIGVAGDRMGVPRLGHR